MENKEKSFKDVLDKMLDVYVEKNLNYGNSFDALMNEFGDVSLAIRLTDKLNRFKSLIKQGSEGTVDERIEDTLLDLANYAVMGIVYKKLQQEIGTIYSSVKLWDIS